VPVTRLSLADFRSYTDAVIAPGPGLVVLTGENGAGKTNVLEAVSLLSPVSTTRPGPGAITASV
jgi:DNA replication and repair protein RecF